MRSRAINNFKRMTLTGNELENIFIPEKRKVCQTCHKIRIKTLISKYNFNEDHRENICFCQSNQNQNLRQQNHHQHDQPIQQEEEQKIKQEEEQKIQQEEEQKIKQEEEQQIHQEEEPIILRQNVEENRLEPPENDEGNQYVTKREFNEFKDEFNEFKQKTKDEFDELKKQIQGIQDNFKESFENISKQIQDLNK